jgi:hypothetical protein
LLEAFELLSEEVTMRCKSSPGSESVERFARARKRDGILPVMLAGSAILAAVSMLSFAPTPAPQLPPKPAHPLLLPETNRPSDANEQMEMREKKTRRLNFDTAHAERLRQMAQSSAYRKTELIALGHIGLRAARLVVETG